LVADTKDWQKWIAFAAGVAVLALPELLWSTTGSATRISEFIGLHFGWDSGETNILWFWIKNTGVLIPLIAAGIYLVYHGRTAHEAAEPEPPAKSKKQMAKRDTPAAEAAGPDATKLLLFYIPFVLLFVVSNTVKLAPWQWDNIKVLVYWFAGSLPFVAYALAWIWRRGTGPLVAAVALILAMTLAGSIDVWRTVSRQVNYKVFSPDAMTVANRIRATTTPDSLFVNAPTYNSAVVLTGRPSYMRYSGHLGSHGIEYRPREEDVKTIYRGGPQADELINRLGIDYVLVSPEELNALQPNEAYFAKFPVTAEAAQYKVYKVR
ncbi:MAG: hypothetical protein QUS14_02140, partial [Pyrinomonadaceae bacterium]|nr:hypothetical protein [Pyrinomonadaceae bacterium]